MNQDLTSLIDRVNQNLRVIPVDGPAVRVSAAEVRFDGGAFTLHLYDVREAPVPRPGGPTENWVSVEVGKFALSPQALNRIKESIAAAETMYTAVMGQPLQSEADFVERSKAFAANAPLQSAKKHKLRG